MVADRATDGGADEAVVADEVTADATDGGALQATPGLGGSGHHSEGREQREDGDLSFHWILSDGVESHSIR
jgi:hypothetical protein